MITRITRLTCSDCGVTQRVKILIAGETEVFPACLSCGANTTWLALPRLRMPDQREVWADQVRLMQAMQQHRIAAFYEGPGCNCSHPADYPCGCSCHQGYPYA